MDDAESPNDELVVALTPKQLAVIALVGTLLVWWRRRRRSA